MGLLDRIFNRNKELGFMFDLELFEETSNRIYMKKLAIETCISFLARTISQTEFRVKNGKEYKKDELYYRLNTRPNKNQTASTFWQQFIYKLIYDNEVLVIQSPADGDLLIADDFEQNEYAVYEDSFYRVIVRDYEFNDVFRQSEVIHVKYSNERLEPLINSLYDDYGKLFASVFAGQRRKNQIRGTVDMDMLAAKSETHQQKLQEFIDNMYKAIDEKDTAIIPQQPGFEYKEMASGGSSQSVDEVGKVANGFLDQVAQAIGVPISLIRGDMADVEKQTKNYMFFTVSPLLKKIKDEADVKFFTKEEHLNGNFIELRKPSYRDIFDLATAVDKLVSSGVFNGNEIRSELGKDMTDEEIHKNYYITKNYSTLEGGEENES